MVDLVDRHAAVLEHLPERRLGAVEQVGGHVLELAAGELLLEVQRAGLAVGDVRQVDRGLARGGQLDLRLLRGLLQALLGDLVGAEVDAVVGLELLDHPLDDAGVPVVTTEVVVTGGRLDLDDALADLEQGHVERAATEVEDEDRLVVALVEAVGQRGRGGLVDDPGHVEARDLAGLLGRLALRVGEVRRHGDHRVGDGLAEVGLGVALELLQHERADLLRGERLVVDLGVPVGAHVALDRTDGAVDVGDRLALGHLADEHLAGLGERDHGRGRAGAFRVCDDGGFATLEDGDDAVRRPEVDADRSCHGCYLRGTSCCSCVGAQDAQFGLVRPSCAAVDDSGKQVESMQLNSAHGVERRAAGRCSRLRGFLRRPRRLYAPFSALTYRCGGASVPITERYKGGRRAGNPTSYAGSRHGRNSRAGQLLGSV